MLGMAAIGRHFVGSGAGHVLVAGFFFLHLHSRRRVRARLNANDCRQTHLERQQQDQ